MTLRALRDWAERRDIPVDVERLPASEDRTHVRVWTKLGGQRVYSEQLVPTAAVDAMIDELASGMLRHLRGA